jgi:hypothetical protein
MRPGVSISLSPAELDRLRGLVKDAPQKHVWRAQIVLLNRGRRHECDHARDKSKTCVWRWQERFAAEGVDGTSARQDAANAHRQARPRHRRTGRRSDHGGTAARRTMTHDCKRNGTTTLFAAMNVLDGTVIGRNMQRHQHQEFSHFLNAVEREVSAGKTIHAILDNYAPHKHPVVRQ